MWLEGDLAVVDSSDDDWFLTPRDSDDEPSKPGAYRRRYVGSIVIVDSIPELRRAEGTCPPRRTPGLAGVAPGRGTT